ncbi:MAG: hypothetical protein Q8L54_05790, partial [Devosia sp.]|nr:hypothetical protein [Devosia sp.]
MPAEKLAELRREIRRTTLADEGETIARLTESALLSGADRGAIGQRAKQFVEKVRAGASSSMLESFLAEYTLSTTEG